MNQTKVVSLLQYQLPAIAWAIFIFTVSSIPQTKLINLIDNTDKLVHGGVFLILCWLLHVAFRFSGNETLTRNSLWLAVVITSFIGMSDEFHQHFTPGRSVDFFDWVADTTGALIYFFLYSRLKFYEWVQNAKAL
jgi:VanZ family protein